MTKPSRWQWALPILALTLGACTPAASSEPTANSTPIAVRGISANGASASFTLPGGEVTDGWTVTAPSGGCAFSLILSNEADGPIVKSDIGLLSDGGERTGVFSWLDVPSGSYVLQEDKTSVANCKGPWSATITTT